MTLANELFRDTNYLTKLFTPYAVSPIVRLTNYQDAYV